MKLINRYFYGHLENMDFTPLKWWNSKRIEYSIRFIVCLYIGQFLFLPLFFQYHLSLTSEFEHLGSTLSFDLSKIDVIIGMVIGNFIGFSLLNIALLIIINVLFFLLPFIEKYMFSKNSESYRKNSFAFINCMNIIFIIYCL